MCIEYNECHYGGMYNINLKRIFVITEIVHMNVVVNSEKENVKESQSRSVAPPLDIHFGCQVGGFTHLTFRSSVYKFSNFPFFTWIYFQVQSISHFNI